MSATAALTAVTLVASAGAAQPEPLEASVGFAVYGWPKPQARRLRQRIREAAREGRLVGLVDPRIEDAVFDGRPPPDPSAAVAEARARLDRAEDQLKAFDITAAKKNVQVALQILQKHLGRSMVRKQDFRRLQLAVGIAHAERDEDALLDHLKDFVQRFWTVAPEKTTWPPDIREQLALVRRRTPMRTLAVTSPVPARATIDGLPVGSTPVQVRVPAGPHRVEVMTEGAFVRQAAVTVRGDANEVTRVDLVPQSPLGDALVGVRSLDAETSARILREANLWGIDVVYAVGPAEGDRIKLQRLGDAPAGPVVVERKMDALRLGLLQIWPSTEPPPETNPWPWVTAGAGAVALGTGIGLRFLARATQDEFQARRASLTQAEAFDLRDQADAEATAGTVLISVGAAGLAAGASWALFEWLREDP